MKNPITEEIIVVHVENLLPHFLGLENKMSSEISWWRTSFGEEEIQKVKESIYKENISMGSVTEEFEKKLASILEAPYAVATTSGSVALLMACMALGIGKGDEVIVPNRTWIATAHAPLILGAKVVLIDSEQDFPSMKISDLEKKITKNTKAIMPVHLNGRSNNMEKILEISKKYNLYVVEDVCQAMLSRNSKGFLGTQSNIGCFSLGTSKLISTGQGGFLVTKDKDIYEKLKLIRNHGTNSVIEPNYTRVGCNFKFTDIQASMGLAQLAKVKEKIEKINIVYNKYRDALGTMSKVKILPVKNLEGEIPLYVEVLCEEKQKLSKFLKTYDINIRPFLPNLNSAPYLKNEDKFVNSDYFYNNGIFLPCGPAQSIQNIERVITALELFEKTK